MQCGSPALKAKELCYYHGPNRLPANRRIPRLLRLEKTFSASELFTMALHFDDNWLVFFR
jgi:hypothetical protein